MFAKTHQNAANVSKASMGLGHLLDARVSLLVLVVLIIPINSGVGVFA